eukprot:1346242-Amorphochlora_amoeboformis.AAC.2
MVQSEGCLDCLVVHWRDTGVKLHAVHTSVDGYVINLHNDCLHLGYVIRVASQAACLRLDERGDGVPYKSITNIAQL